MSHIFISYSHKDSEYANQLGASLEASGFQVWIDRRIDYGAEWSDVIEAHLNECGAFVLIMSRNAKTSTWVKNELSRAQRLNKPIFPIWIDGDIWLAVESLQHFDAREGGMPPQKFYTQLAQIIPPEVSAPALLPDFEPPKLPLPEPFEWCAIPSGTVTLSEGERQTVETVAPFYIAKYPITNAQFRVFAKATGTEVKPSAFAGDDVPRTNVTWNMATDFCSWLTREWGDGIIWLPDEAEWQRAAQGDENRRFPWGDQFDVACCNTRESQKKQATPVWQYPQGISSFGVLDMSGNVWEWCDDLFEIDGRPYAYARGGAWTSSQHEARVTFQAGFPADDWNYDRGFRIVAMTP